LDVIAAQLRLVLDEQRAMRDELRAVRLELRRITENQAGMLRLIDKLSDRFEQQREELVLTIKIEIGGLFGHLETRLASPPKSRLGWLSTRIMRVSVCDS